MDQKADKIVNLGHADTVCFNGTVVINTSSQLPLSSLLPGTKETVYEVGDKKTDVETDEEPKDADNKAKKQAEKLQKALPKGTYLHWPGTGIPMFPSDEPPYQKAEHPDGTVLHGLVFRLTIPEAPLMNENSKRKPSIPVMPDYYERIFRSFTEKRKIHTCSFGYKTLTGAINEEDMRWNWEWDRPENVITMFCRFVDDVFSFCTKETDAIKFRVYCSFLVGDYLVKSGMVFGKTMDEVSAIHKGMEYLFTPVSTDYNQVHEYETAEFKESRKRHYYTPYSRNDYLDEGIIIGTTDLDFIGGYGSWFKPILCSEYKDSKAIIMYRKLSMPGLPHGFLEKAKRAILDFWD